MPTYAHPFFVAKNQETPAHFFDVVCPRVMAARARGGQVIAFVLEGTDGGRWTLDFGAAAVRSGADHAADVTLRMPAADFTALLDGTLPIEAKMRAGQLVCEGDASALGALAAFRIGERR